MHPIDFQFVPNALFLKLRQYLAVNPETRLSSRKPLKRLDGRTQRSSALHGSADFRVGLLIHEILEDRPRTF